MKKLLILSGVRWNFPWQRHHSLAQAAASEGWQVTFVEPAPRSVVQVLRFVSRRLGRGHKDATQVNPVPKGVTVVSFLGFVWGRATGLVSTRRSRVYDLGIVYVPTWMNLAFSMRAARRRVYDCVVDWSAAPRDWHPPRSAWLVERTIGNMARSRRFGVTTDSSAIVKRFGSTGVSAVELPPAADEVFCDYQWSAGAQGKLGYFGSVRASEVDVELLCELAEKGGSVEVIGPLDDNSRELLKASQVGVVPPQSLNNLVRYVDDWSAILLPYRETDRSASLVPAKLWNALGTRKLVLYKGISLPSDLRPYECSSPVAGLSAIQVGPLTPVPRWVDTFSCITEVANEQD